MAFNEQEEGIIPDVVHRTGTETIEGVKTFTDAPIVPDDAYDATAWNADFSPPTKNAVRDLAITLAIDSFAMHLAGNETVTGVKTFSAAPIIPDEAYAAGWNGNMEPPTKNAVYDKMELAAALQTLQQTLDTGSDITSTETITTGVNTLIISTASANTNPLKIIATTGRALEIASTGAEANIRAIKTTHVTDSVVEVLDFDTRSSGPTADGFGSIISNKLQAAGGAFVLASQIQTLWLNANDSDAILNLIVANQGVPINRLSIHGRKGIQAQGRLQEKKGVAVESANLLTLGEDGTVFHITGSGYIDTIESIDWQDGAKITLIIDGDITFRNAMGSGSTDFEILLAGGVDFVANDKDVFVFVLDAQYLRWLEVSRSIN